MEIWHVYVSNRMSPVNGVVQAIHQLAQAQRAAGAQVRVLHGTDQDPMRGPACGSARGLVRELRSWTATAPPEVVHVHELFRPPHLALRRLLATTPHVLSAHGATAPPNLVRYGGRKAVWSACIDRPAATRAQALIALTGQEREDLHRWAPTAPPATVIPNPADPALLAAPGWRPPDDTRQRLVSLSRWDVRHKGLDRLSALADRLPEVHVVVHGAPCGNEADRLAEVRARAGTNLELARPVSGQARTDALLGAHGFVLLSRWEGLSMALLEAMALGVPCFTSPEVAATIDARGTTIVVPNDPATGARVVAAALDDVDLLGEVGASGRAWVARHASPTAVATATLDLYRSIAAQPRPHVRVPA